MKLLLEAAAEVVAEKGYDAATTNEIARRAGTSIGSLYQFFPNKAALMHALALEYIQELRELLDTALATPLEGTWQDIVGRIVDTFADFHQNRAGFEAIWLGGHVTPELIQTAMDMGREIATKTEPLLEMLTPGLDSKRRGLVARVCVEVVGACLLLSHERRYGREAVVEAKAVILAYLSRFLEA